MRKDRARELFEQHNDPVCAIELTPGQCEVVRSALEQENVLIFKGEIDGEHFALVTQITAMPEAGSVGGYLLKVEEPE